MWLAATPAPLLSTSFCTIRCICNHQYIVLLFQNWSTIFKYYLQMLGNLFLAHLDQTWQTAHMSTLFLLMKKRDYQPAALRPLEYGLPVLRFCIQVSAFMQVGVLDVSINRLRWGPEVPGAGGSCWLASGGEPGLLRCQRVPKVF